MDTKPKFTKIKEIISFLASSFPNCFTTEGDAKPLKIGIFQDLAQRLAEDETISNKQLRIALRNYTMNWRYLHCIKEGKHRVDLDGNNCQVITEQEALHAKMRLDESKAKVQANNIKHKKSANNKTQIKQVNKTTNTKKLNSNKVEKETVKFNINDLKVGQLVKIIISSKEAPATISSIKKDSIKVRIQSGMEITVTTDKIIL